MAGIPQGSEEQEARKQAVLDYMCEHIGDSYSAEHIAEGTGIPLEEVKVAAEALAYAQELAKTRTEGGQATYRRNP